MNQSDLEFRGDLEYIEYSESEAIAIEIDRDDAATADLSFAEEEIPLDRDEEGRSLSMTPRFITKIHDVSVKKGHQALFECVVPESKGICVKWLKDGKEIELITRIRVWSKNSDDGKTQTHQLILDAVNELDKGKYSVVISNDHGTESCTAELVVEAPEKIATAPEFTQKLTNITIKEGSEAKFECKVQADTKPEIEWFKDGEKISPSAKISIATENDGTSRLVIKEAKKEDSGNFEVVAKTIAGKATSKAELRVEVPLKFITELKSMTRNEKETAKFECQTNRVPKPQEIKWTKNGQEIGPQTPRTKIDLKSDGQIYLTITETTIEDIGEYRCEVAIDGEKVETKAQLNVESEFFIFRPFNLSKFSNLGNST